jgi:hypothetical protein
MTYPNHIAAIGIHGSVGMVGNAEFRQHGTILQLKRGLMMIKIHKLLFRISQAK